jgi:hypothetical protein
VSVVGEMRDAAAIEVASPMHPRSERLRWARTINFHRQCDHGTFRLPRGSVSAAARRARRCPAGLDARMPPCARSRLIGTLSVRPLGGWPPKARNERTDSLRVWRGILRARGHSARSDVMPINTVPTQQAREAARRVSVARADARAAALAPVIAEIRTSGITAPYAIAAALTARGVPTARGHRF